MYQDGHYTTGKPIIDFTGRYTVMADGSVILKLGKNGGIGETYQRRSASLYSANGPTPWVQWDQEKGPYRRPTPVPPTTP